MTTTKRDGGGESPLRCPGCRAIASAQHFKENEHCAAIVAKLRGMLNVAQRKHAVAGPGRPKGSGKKQKKGGK